MNFWSDSPESSSTSGSCVPVDEGIETSTKPSTHNCNRLRGSCVPVDEGIETDCTSITFFLEYPSVAAASP